MKLSLAEPKFLKESVTIISDLVNEARLKIGKDAIEMVAMDPANVAMVIFKLFSSAFSEYSVDKETNLAINLNNLKQILRRAKPNDMVTLEMDDNRLKITLRGESIRTFSIPIIDLEHKEQRIPELTFPVSIETSSVFLNEAIEDADIVAESVMLIAEPQKFTVKADGDLSTANIEIKAGPETKIILEGKEKIKAKYSVEYLKKMMQGSKLADKVTINFNHDYPLRINYNAIDRVMLSFILAPRVEND